MKRECGYENETIGVVISNCKEFLEKRNTIYLEDVYVLLNKALENVEGKNDLCDREKEIVKKIREIIKGL